MLVPTVLTGVSRLEELAHQLSNSVGLTMNSLILAATGDKDELFDRLVTATDQAMQSTGSLQMLMWELRELRCFLESATPPTNSQSQ